MDYGRIPSAEDDAEALKQRRAGLRAFVEGVAEAVQALQLPETYLEAERAARAVTVADRITQKLGPEAFDGEEVTPPSRTSRDHDWPYDSLDRMGGRQTPWDGEEKEAPTTIASDGPPPHKWGGREECIVEPPRIGATLRVRLGLRAYADRVMEAATFIPRPDCFLEAERAGRYAMACDRMLTQLYAPPKATPPLEHDADEDEDLRPSGSGYTRCKGVYPDDIRALWADWQFRLEEDILAMQKRDKEKAEKSGFWFDGRPYVPEPDETDEPVRYNPDGTVYQNREETERNIAAERAAAQQDDPP